MSASESALVVLFPTIDPIVSSHRATLDSGAIRGVPAHVTVLYPFVPPELISAAVLTDLRRLLGSFAPFDVTFDAVGWFGDDVVSLRPTPDLPFRRLTSAIASRWPDWPPYGGAHGEPTPHLTIGDSGTREQLARVAEATARSLPIEARASTVHLFTGSHEPDSWTARTEIPLDQNSSIDDHDRIR